MIQIWNIPRYAQLFLVHSLWYPIFLYTVDSKVTEEASMTAGLLDRP